MKIQSSTVAMSSDRSYTAIHEKQSAELITTDAQAATLEFSDESKSLLEQLADNKVMLVERAKEREQQNAANILISAGSQTKKTGEGVPEVSDQYKLKLEILKRMLAALRDKKFNNLTAAASEMKQLQSEYKSSMQAFRSAAAQGSSVSAGLSTKASSGWTKTTVTSEFFAEVEHTCYTANGIVKTADGREIGFGVSVEMSRGFCAKYESLVQEEYICTDPLVINLDTLNGSVSNQKFLFDLDSDGKEEEISFAGQGSGFLALDKNGDGVINDGSELFGTRSGDGFRDLAAYDEDGNGWIDENDSVFHDLRIWTKDEDGNNRLISFKEAGVGAICLQSASTQFSLNRADDNHTNGIIRNTGVYLKENGEAGTIQHIDLTL